MQDFLHFLIVVTDFHEIEFLLVGIKITGFYHIVKMFGPPNTHTKHRNVT